jgi:hypothetical protein
MCLEQSESEPRVVTEEEVIDNKEYTGKGLWCENKFTLFDTNNWFSVCCSPSDKSFRFSVFC